MIKPKVMNTILIISRVQFILFDLYFVHFRFISIIFKAKMESNLRNPKGRKNFYLEFNATVFHPTMSMERDSNKKKTTTTT